MPVTKEELGHRLRAAREASQMTQLEVGQYVGVSRSTIAQMELGNRAITSLELDKLAYLYGRDIREFLTEQFREEDSFVALFRRHPEVQGQEGILQSLRQCTALGREITNLERLLGIDRDLTALAVYQLPAPRTKWDAIQQGDRVACEERRRLGLGKAPLPNVAELLETLGVRTAQVDLPDDVSGITLVEPDLGVMVVANLRHHFLRRRFSYAHEYCHALLDRDRRGTISRGQDRDNLLEVRANSFAASFLLPAEGVMEFVHKLAKGRHGRLQAQVFDEQEALPARARFEQHSQAIQLYDVVLLAHHFRVSRISTLYRLMNLRLITESEFQHLKLQDVELGQDLSSLLNLPEPDHEEARREFRHRFLALGLEAFRRGDITKSKLRELVKMVGAEVDELDKVLADAELDEGPSEVLLPSG